MAGRRLVRAGGRRAPRRAIAGCRARRGRRRRAAGAAGVDDQGVPEQVGPAHRVQPQPVPDRAGLAERPQQDRLVQFAVQLQRRGGVGEGRADVDHEVGPSARNGLAASTSSGVMTRSSVRHVGAELDQQVAGLGGRASGRRRRRTSGGRWGPARPVALSARSSLDDLVDELAEALQARRDTRCRSRSTSSLPMTAAQTARPARKPEAPSRQASSTAWGNRSAGTPDESTTHGDDTASVICAQRRRISSAGPWPFSGTSAL